MNQPTSSSANQEINPQPTSPAELEAMTGAPDGTPATLSAALAQTDAEPLSIVKEANMNELTGTIANHKTDTQSTPPAELEAMTGTPDGTPAALSGPPPHTDAKPISDKKLEANRRNTRLSTGPKTDAGNDNSRQNTLKPHRRCTGRSGVRRGPAWSCCLRLDFRKVLPLYRPVHPRRQEEGESDPSLNFTCLNVRKSFSPTLLLPKLSEPWHNQKDPTSDFAPGPAAVFAQSLPALGARNPGI